MLEKILVVVMSCAGWWGGGDEIPQVIDLEKDGEMLEYGVDIVEVEDTFMGYSCDILGNEYVFDFPVGLFSKSKTDCEISHLHETVLYYFTPIVKEDLSGDDYEVRDGVYEFVDIDSLDTHIFGYVNWRLCETGVDGFFLVEADWDWNFEKNEFVIDISDHMELDEFVDVCKSFKRSEI